jgi:HSP20 family molecular chaperone IbpA
MQPSISCAKPVKTDNASARFKDGVLEVTVDASQVANNRRRIQIQEESAGKPGKSAA